MEHACNALSEAETAAYAHLSNHAWRCMGAHEDPATNGLKGDSGEGGEQSYKVRGEVGH